MSDLSKSDVIEVLGSHLNDAVIADVVATGITKDELVAAKARVLQDRASHTHGPKLEPGRFAKVVDILERLRERGILGRAGSTLE
jgi:hypothetical protein